MKKTIAIIALSAGVIAAPSFVAAGQYNSDTACQQTVNNRTTSGGLIGAGVGAVAGSQVAARGNRNEGAVLGAVIGAVVGSQIGKNNVACDDAYQASRRDSRYDNDRRDYGNYNDRDYRNSGYDNDRRGHDNYRSHHARYNPPVRYSNQNRCGWGTAAYRLPNGRIVNDQVWMCRNRHGEWVATNR